MNDELNQVDGATPEEPREPLVESSPEKEDSSIYEQKTLPKRDEAFSRLQGERDRAVEAARRAEETLRKIQDEREREQEDLDRRALEAVIDDPEKHSAMKIRIEARKEKAQARKDAEDMQRALEAKYKDAAKLSEEYGVPMSELLEASSFYEMENIALKKTRITKQSTKTETKPEPKYPGGTSTAPGGKEIRRASLKDMEVKDLMAIEKELDEAHRSGKLR